MNTKCDLLPVCTTTDYLLEIHYMANVSCPKAVDISPLSYQLLYIIPPSKCNQNDTKTAIYTKLLKTEIWNCLHALFQNCSRPNCSSTCRSLPWTKYRTGAWLWSKFLCIIIKYISHKSFLYLEKTF